MTTVDVITSTMTSEDLTANLHNLSDFYESLNQETVMSLLPTLIYIGILMIMGAVGNTVVFLVYCKRFKPSSTRSFVLSMSVFDLCSNMFALPGEIADIRYSYNYDIPWLCKAVRFVNSFLTLVSAFILVTVALDRHRKICHPLSKQFSQRRVLVSITACAMMSTVLSAYFAVINGRHSVNTTLPNIKGVTCSIDDVYVGGLFPLIYSAIMALTFIACVVMMVVCYARIMIRLWQHRRRSSLNRTKGNFLTRLKEFRKNLQTGEDDSSSDFNQTASGSQQTPDTLSSVIQSSAVGYYNKNTISFSNTCVTSLCHEGVELLKVRSRDEDSDPTSRQFSVPEAIESTPKYLDTDSSHLIESALPNSLTQISETKYETNSKRVNDLHTDNQIQLPVQSDGPKDTMTGLQTELNTNYKLKSQTTKMQKRNPQKEPMKMHCNAGKKIPTSTTFMMFVLTAMFIISYLPHLAIISAREAVDNWEKSFNSGITLNVYNIALRSYFINCAVNPLVYSFCSAKFRYECRGLLGCKK